MKNKKLTRLGALLASALILIGSTLTVCAEETYTYNYDYWGEIQYMPDAYEVVNVFASVDLGLDVNMSNPKGLFCYGDYVYVADTGNNRIIVIERQSTEDFVAVQIIDEFYGDCDVLTLSGPTDITVTEDYYYICDKGNQRIVKLDKDLNYIMSFTKPSDSTIGEDASYNPDKIVVDTAGRVYCIATGINQGLIKYEADGTFTGFIGATEVVFELWDYIWKRIATEEQRAQMASFTPTEYDGIYIDHDGFIYAVTSNVDADDLKSGDAEAVRKLNLLGDNILVENGNWPVYGDLYMGDGGGYSGPSAFVDITAFDNDIYVCLDSNRGRLFAYDDQGNLLFAFGGNGNMDGYFRKAAAIDHMGYDLIVLDSTDCSITVFTPTEFGSLIYEAIDEFNAGEYSASGETWQKVMDIDGNYDLAYIGIGRSLLRAENYKEAMQYFKLKYDDENYSKAFKQYRKEWVQENIAIIFAVVFAILIIPLLIGKIKAIKHEIDTADIFKFQ